MTRPKQTTDATARPGSERKTITSPKMPMTTIRLQPLVKAEGFATRLLLIDMKQSHDMFTVVNRLSLKFRLLSINFTSECFELVRW